MASHPVGHSAAAAKNRSGTYYSNRSRWPFEQVGMLVAARKELADWRGASRCALGSLSRSPRWLVLGNDCFFGLSHYQDRIRHDFDSRAMYSVACT